MRNATTESQIERMDELDEDLIEVSSHAGARPLCAPYQGHVYSRTGKSTQYPSLDSTSYGEPAGLFGINCGHVMYPYFPGTKQTYKPTDDESQNVEDYKESQKQRQIERSIRSDVCIGSFIKSVLPIFMINQINLMMYREFF